MSIQEENRTHEAADSTVGETARKKGQPGTAESMLRRADSLGARVCLVIGDAEVQAKQVQLKDLASHTQELCGWADVLGAVSKVMASAPKPSEAKP